MSRVRTAVLQLSVSALLVLFASNLMAATLDELADDGLYTWRVAAVAEAPSWCCYQWAGGKPKRRACDLDSSNTGFSSGDDNLPATEEVQIYIDIQAGEIRTLRTLSTNCPVSSRRDIQDLGLLEVAESLDWLRPRVTSEQQTSDDALAAIAVHRGKAAYQYLQHLAENGKSMELRKESLFWMGQTRIGESAGQLQQYMFRSPDADIREHAAFSYAQSTATDRSAVLVRQGRDDADAEVRSQAWFWLAQTGATNSEKEIQWAIENDRDNEVREEAVFALSQLPGERAVDALFAVLGNLELNSQVREQALFWLVQSDSDRAYAYVDQLLADQP